MNWVMYELYTDNITINETSQSNNAFNQQMKYLFNCEFIGVNISVHKLSLFGIYNITINA